MQATIPVEPNRSLLCFLQVDEWDSDPADVDLYDRDDVDWDGQYSSGRKRRLEREGVVVDVDSFTRKFRRPRMETCQEINQRMLSVELAVKEALSARGEMHFTDEEFPPNDESLYVDPKNPPSKLQVLFLSDFLIFEVLNQYSIFFISYMFLSRLFLSG